MTKGIKIVTIGGGSSYTPELMEGFIKRYEELPISEMWLVDIEDGKEKLEVVGKMAQRMWDASPYDVKVHLTLDRREALKDADFVTTQFRVGLLNARIKDERIPLSYGMAGQETNGAGGIFKAFRTIPIILSIVEDMKELCPNAWLINFTNPSGMVTDAIIRYGKWEKVIGLCNVPVNAMIAEPELIGKNLDELIYTFAGLNHFHWHRVKDLTGNDVTSEIIDKLYDGDSGIPSNIFDVPFFKEQLKQMNMIPCGYHRYYYRYDEMLEHLLEEYNDSNVGTRAQQVKQTEAELFELYKDPNLNYKPEQLAKRGGAHYSDAACETIASIYANKNTHIVVSTKNNGAVPDLAPDDVVEVSAYIGAAGARPIAFGTLQPAERGWLQVMKNMELCVEEAAVTGDYGLALQAFIINPLIPSGETAKRVLDELLIAHKRYLPQFAEKIAELEAVGITVKDEIARNLY
ncbi:6-phospho-beta-glucosidase [Bacillus wiedmannii]|uniref:6-phospho-beta-glucosidase n=1 Tax=Bacillus wiedmannii TaxID=1890302 RepID=UPI000BF40A55|nr:6-phospho-beta-glucosidase [Bacillus wiedmannii]PEN43638.1 6-phospho-beta-glucosidase [Bacillus wiedmannii]PFZ56565.1 6-phospho-beta-glucosidase [Bacillus wiedmannii]PHB64177.1 6-phospho-beta-glucosidase [Bacillus wiedmannii]PHF23948.1 6-phospho-beta-glucosidase [Bacillus wiedmannii]PHG57667.1 6-phospho-beta-glucosidase [Bacillus wiedmannii]